VSAKNVADAQKLNAGFADCAFVAPLINFVIVAWILFTLVKAANRMRELTRRNNDNMPFNASASEARGAVPQ
jgi:large-conductance mechanosensitive channel